jgi:hypothetical protein
MNTQKSIYNKLFKAEVQLESHKVELALIDDLNKAVADASKNEASFYSDFKQSLNRVIDDARKIEIKYNVLASNINEPVFQMEKQAKELGLDFKGNPLYKKSQDTLRQIESRKEVIDSIVKNIQKFGF